MGVPNSNVTLRPALIPYYYRWNAGAAFVQDDWKIRPNLTLNLGVRYSIEMPRTEKYNNQGVFRPDLAQSFPLSSPLTLSDGEVVTSALAPVPAWSVPASDAVVSMFSMSIATEPATPTEPPPAPLVALAPSSCVEAMSAAIVAPVAVTIAPAGRIASLRIFA